MLNFTLGADPELFIFNRSNNKIVSSIGIIPGVKGKPWRSNDMPEGFGLEIDNILAEFNIPPCKTKKEWVENINYMKDYIRSYVRRINPDYDILCKASEYVDYDQLTSPESQLFGCSVDYNAYTKAPNPKPEGDKTNLRSTGCHIHVGYDDPEVDRSVELVKYMDLYVGVPSLLFDKDVDRRKLYGKAGCFRLTDYGVEYRVLSGAFLANDDLLGFMWSQTVKALVAWDEGRERISEETVVNIINTADFKAAHNVVKSFCLL